MEGYLEAPPIAGPGPIGQLAAIAVGAYTDIVSVIAPAEAAYGDWVSVEVRVKNLADYGIYIAVTGRHNGVDISFSPEYATVDPGATYSFTSSFRMPDSDIRLDVWSFFWTGTEWYQDDYDYVDIALKITYEGTISRKELEHDGARDSIPAYDIPQNERGLVHMWGRNDTSVTQRMGIWWQVRDPDGRIVEEYSAWEFWPYTSPGDDHEFIGDRVYLDKPGTYTISIQLFMNPDDQVVVDDYYGTLCTVEAAVPEPSFRRFGMTEYITA